MIRPHRRHALWLAFALHRASGLLLALFLPVHFWVLSQALTDTARLEGALRFADAPAVKAAELGLVFLLAVHLFGGLRLLALEFLPWRAPHKTLAATALGLAFMVAGAFLLQVV